MARQPAGVVSGPGWLDRDAALLAHARRELALAYLRGEDSTAAPAWRPPAEAADLAAAAASIERTARMLLEALPAAQAVAEERAAVRRTLAEIAEAIGTLAGAVEALPPATDTGQARDG